MNNYSEIDSDLLLLAAEGGDYNCKEIAARISDMNVNQRRLLRKAVNTLDELLDADALDRRENGGHEKK